MRKKILIWITIILSTVFFVIGIPILINEAYKNNSGYMTMWGASEVLYFYGTILGSMIAVATLVVTIIFTRKQIYRNSYLQTEQEKWSKLESIFSKSLDSINPLSPLDQTVKIGQANPYEAISVFQQYQRHCNNPTDALLSSLSDKDYPQVKILIDRIIEASQQFGQIAQKSVNAYSLLAKYNGRDTALKTIEIEERKPGTFPADNIKFCQNLLRETDGIQSNLIQQDIISSATKLSDSYVDFYRPLLQLKGTTFDIINKQIEDTANGILYFGRK